MKMTGETKFFLGILVGSLVLLVIGMVLFSRPEPTFTRDDLIPEGTVTKGNPDAQHYLVEFSDFQCPACKAASPTIKKIIEKHGDKLLFAYRHFPLEQHEYAQKAGQAAEAANEQEKFWEMHDFLFANQDELSDDLVMEYAQELELDIDIFQESFTMGKYKDKILSDRSFALRSGANSTPTFFLDGKKLLLSTIGDLEKEVEKAVNN